MSDDARFDDLIRREAKGYRSGDDAPADAMWSRIESDVARAIRAPRHHGARRWPWLASVTGIAAALVIGIAIGRRSTAKPDAPEASSTLAAVTASADSARDTRMRVATVNHFLQAEMFLTEVRADLMTGRNDPQRAERSRQLLARTRLLMANDATPVPAIERLLEDLELVLAEIAALPDSGDRPIDARLLDERLRVGTVLPRIRTIVPPPSSMGGA